MFITAFTSARHLSLKDTLIGIAFIFVMMSKSNVCTGLDRS